MGHAVLPQHREVHGGEELLVPDLDRVPPLPRQRREELVQPGGEPLGRHAARPADGLELEDERPGMVGEVALIGLVDRLQEQVGVQKIGLTWPARALSCALLKVCTVSWFHTLLTHGNPGGRCFAYDPSTSSVGGA